MVVMVDFRKLISFGKTSFVTSIPKAWVVKNHLKKGDLIAVEEKDGNLILSAKKDNAAKSPEQKEVIITTDKKDIVRIKRELSSAYINSFNPIILTGKDITEKSLEVRNALNNLIALEVMEETSEKIIAKDFLNMDKISIQGAIKKMDLIIRSMIMDSKLIKSEEDYISVYHRDEDVNRLSFLVYRAVKYALDNPNAIKAYNTNTYELLHFWFIATYLEKIGDTAKRIARNLKDIDPKNAAKLMGFYSLVEARYLDTMKSFYNNDIPFAFKIADSKKDTMIKVGEAVKNSKPLVADTIVKMLQMIADIHDITRTTYLFLNNTQA
jgi:phosphate uptake regulator